MDFSTIGSVSAITVIVMLLAQGIKFTTLENKWIPFLCGVIGALLGIIGYFVMANFPAGDVLSAAAVGIVSGLAATGAHQTYHQLSEGYAKR